MSEDELDLATVWASEPVTIQRVPREEATGLDGYLDSIEGTPEGDQQNLGAKLAQLQEQVPEVEEIDDGGLGL